VSLALYRKYRPATFAELKGQEHVAEPLQQALRNGRINHAYLFSGPRGCGKTSSARILARSLNCEQGPTPEPCGVCDSCVALGPTGSGHIDVIEIDAASHGGVDDARDLRERAFFAPVAGRFKIYIIDEAHMVTREGFNALLKLVEEPPPHLKFVFATTEPEKVIGTIRSRTHHYPFRLIPPGVLKDLLEEILTAENVPFEPAALPLVVRAGAGSARDSLSILDQLLAGSDAAGITYARSVLLLGYTDASLLDEVVDAFAARDGAAVFAAVDRVIESGQDPRRFAADLLGRFRDLVVLANVPDAGSTGLLDQPVDELERMRRQATGLGRAELTRAADLLHTGLTEMRGATSPRLLLELVCARILLPGAYDDEASLLTRLERMERRLALGGADTHYPQPAENQPAVRGGTPAHGRSGPAGGGGGAAGPGRTGESGPGSGSAHAGADRAGPGEATPAGSGGTDQAGAAAGGPTGARGGQPAAGGSAGGTDWPASARPGSGRAAAAGQAEMGSAQAGPSGGPGSDAESARAGSGSPAGARGGQSGAGGPGSEQTGPGGAADPGAGASGRTPGRPGAGASGGAEAGPGRSDGEDASGGAPVAGGLDVAAVRRSWPDILEIVKRKSRVAWMVLMEGVQVAGLEGNLLTLSFDNEGKRKGFTSGGRDAVVREALKEFLGVDWRIDTVTGGVLAPGGRVGGGGGRPAPRSGPGGGGQAGGDSSAGPGGSGASGGQATSGSAGGPGSVASAPRGDAGAGDSGSGGPAQGPGGPRSGSGGPRPAGPEGSGGGSSAKAAPGGSAPRAAGGWPEAATPGGPAAVEVASGAGAWPDAAVPGGSVATEAGSPAGWPEAAVPGGSGSAGTARTAARSRGAAGMTSAAVQAPPRPRPALPDLPPPPEAPMDESDEVDPDGDRDAGVEEAINGMALIQRELGGQIIKEIDNT
jgi:DNA polymerase-3 subunit gamma/tau